MATCQSKSVLLESKSSASISAWLHRPYISPMLRERLSTANLLIVPIEHFPNAPGPVFPVQTEDLFHFLKDRSPKEITPEICIEDDDYKELALHHDVVHIGELIFTSVVAPVVVTLLVEYIRDRLRARKHADPIVKLGLTIEGSDRSATRLYYEGSAADFERMITPAIEAIHHEVTSGIEIERGGPNGSVGR